MNRIVVLISMLLLGMNAYSQLSEKEFNPIDSLYNELNNSKDIFGKAQLLHKLMNEYIKIDKDSSINIGEQALKYFKELDMDSAVASFYIDYGLIYYKSSKFDKAIDHWNISLKEYYEKIKESTKKADIISNIGEAYRLKGDYDVGLEYQLKALKIREMLNDSVGLTRSLNNIGICYYFMNELDKTVDYFEKSLELKLLLKQEKLAISSYINLALMYQKLDKHQQAVNQLQKAISLSKQHDPSRLANIEMTLGIGYIENNKLDSAIIILEKAVVTSKETKNIQTEGLCYNHLSSAYFKINNFNKALENGKKALEVGEYVDSKQDLKESHFLISQAYEKLNNYELSLSHYKIYTAIKDSMFSESKSKELGKLEANYEMEKKLMEAERIKEDEIRMENERIKRRNSLQYSGIFTVILILFALVFVFGKISLNERLAEGLIFFAFLILFEFLLVLTDPYVDNLTNSEPMYKLLVNAILAGAIFPAHAFFESLLKKKLIDNKKANN